MEKLIMKNIIIFISKDAYKTHSALSSRANIIVHADAGRANGYKEMGNGNKCSLVTIKAHTFYKLGETLLKWKIVETVCCAHHIITATQHRIASNKYSIVILLCI